MSVNGEQEPLPTFALVVCDDAVLARLALGPRVGRGWRASTSTLHHD